MRELKPNGFTIVELFIVITVIAILVSLTVFGFGSWRSRTAKAEVKNELMNASRALENNRNFKNGYPATGALATIYAPKTQVILTYTLRPDSKSYCLRGISQKDGSIVQYIDSNNGSSVPSDTTCS